VNTRLYEELRDILDEAKTRRGYALSQLSRAKGQGDG